MKHTFTFSPVLLLLAWAFQGCTIVVPSPQTSVPQSGSSVTFSDPVLNQRRILLFGEISERVAAETIQKLFYLDAQREAPIDLYLMTPGGDMKAALAIENTIRLIHSRVNTYALWECNSGGALLLAAGTGQRAAFRGAIILVHGLKVHGSPPNGYLDGIQAYYTTFWRQRAKLPAQWLPIPLNALHCLTAEQALEYGLIDRILPGQPTLAEPGGAANLGQPVGSQTNRTSAAAGPGG